MGEVKNIDSQEAYDALKGAESKICLFFWADWHAPSQEGGQMHDVLQTLAKKYKDICFARVNAEDLPEVATEYNVTVVPTTVCVGGGKTVGQVAGANPPELSKLVRAFNTSKSAGTAATSVFKADPVAALNARLKALIATAPVMLFMKGTPEEPRCGFSRKIVALLNEQEVPFASFNILEDEEVRQGLKTYSEWPTYPQLYVKAELQGGLDILTDMAVDGGLKEQFLGKDGAAGAEAMSVDTTDPLETRLKALIEKDSTMLFMKGVPDAPQCGFSRTIVGILQDEGISFSSFNILEDEEVRQGLKTYSDWPTYPQLYHKGELLGGLDIVQEMQQEGPLKDQLESA